MLAESRLYLQSAERDLEVAAKKLELGYFYVAISRAYYAMFYAASAVLASRGIMRGKHSGVLSAFGEYFVRTGVSEPEYAKMLGRTFDSRLDSEYDVTFVAERSTAEEVIRDARGFVERIRRYLEEATDESSTQQEA